MTTPSSVSQPAAALRRWSFGDAVLDERTLELRVGATLAELERKPLEVLIYLLEHAGEAVTKDELAEALWPGRILTETVLTRCISLLRQSLHDDARAIIKTVHGYGYRLMAPVKVELLSAAVPPQRFGFKPGDAVPQRLQWRMQRCLGRGGHGEVWLAQHEKTHEMRVYKFAHDGEALTALKREITLYRLLHDSLGERPDLVRIIDWNLQEPPCFLESEYASGGSLLNWAEAQGGIAEVPLASRLELLAQIAETLAAAHGVGVLHKDLKPANVLIELVLPPPQVSVASGTMGVRIKLSDFGSGGVLEPDRLDALGITRLGFSRSLAAGEMTSGTPLYLAPEVIARQPSTVQADIYALGVMLYQLCIGDLTRPLAAGWEHDVDDELLREDIAAAADGHPQRRLADAGLLAQRLRSLEPRRRQRAAERAAEVELARARSAALHSQQVMERLRARRSWMLTAMAALVIGLAASLWLYLDVRKARNQALASAATAGAVSSFLNFDLLLSADPGKGPTRDLRVKDLLDRAAAMVDQRFADEPEAAARVHYSLAQSYEWLSLPATAQAHAQQAVDLFERVKGRQAEDTLSALLLLAKLDSNLSQTPAALRLRQEVLGVLLPRLGAHHPRVLQVQADIAYGQYLLGDFRQPVLTYSALVNSANKAQPPLEPMRVNEWKRWQGWLLAAAGDFEQAETVLRQVVEERSRVLGSAHLQTAIARYNLGRILTQRGLYTEANSMLEQVLSDHRKWLGDPHIRIAYALWALGELRLEQGRPDEALVLLNDAMQRQLAVYGPEDQDSAWLSYLLAQTYQQQGRLEEAARTFFQGLAVEDKLDGPQHPMCIAARVDLADVLLAQGKPLEAWAVLRQIPAEGLRALPEQHPFLANLRRQEGLLWLQEKHYGKARAALDEALKISLLRYGPRHWRTLRLEAELARVPGAR